jgi:hypothetical protein
MNNLENPENNVVTKGPTIGISAQQRTSFGAIRKKNDLGRHASDEHHPGASDPGPVSRGGASCTLPLVQYVARICFRTNLVYPSAKKCLDVLCPTDHSILCRPIYSIAVHLAMLWR